MIRYLKALIVPIIVCIICITIIIHTLKESDRIEEERQKIKYEYWVKVTGNKHDLNYKEWKVIRPDLD